MDVLTVVMSGVLLALFTGIQAWINHGRFAAIDARFDRVDARIDRVESELAELRSMVMQIALTLGSQPRPQTG